MQSVASGLICHHLHITQHQRHGPTAINHEAVEWKQGLLISSPLTKKTGAPNRAATVKADAVSAPTMSDPQIAAIAALTNETPATPPLNLWGPPEKTAILTAIAEKKEALSVSLADETANERAGSVRLEILNVLDANHGSLVDGRGFRETMPGYLDAMRGTRGVGLVEVAQEGQMM